jgi:hypothetical protein
VSSEQKLRPRHIFKKSPRWKTQVENRKLELGEQLGGRALAGSVQGPGLHPWHHRKCRDTESHRQAARLGHGLS